MQKRNKVPTVVVTPNELRQIEVPAVTQSYNPLPYPVMRDKIVATANQILTPLGYTMSGEHYKVREDGSQMFGTMTWSNGQTTGMDFLIGCRNSYDKSIAAAFCCGTSILVCDNMCFSGDIVHMHKNTTNVITTFEEKLVLKLHGANQFYEGQVLRLNRYKEISLSRDEVYRAFGRAGMEGVLSPQQWTAAVREWENPTYEEHAGNTVFNLYQAMNTPLKGSLPREILQAHKGLDNMFKAMWN